MKNNNGPLLLHVFFRHMKLSYGPKDCAVAKMLLVLLRYVSNHIFADLATLLGTGHVERIQ